MWPLLFGLWTVFVAQPTRGDDFASLVRRNTSIFHHRAFGNSIVVGDYLYWDGGEVTTWNGNGDGLQATNPQSRGDILTAVDYYTYGISLSSSWTNSTFTQLRSDKTAPQVNTLALWADVDGETFYAYDGGLSEASTDWLNIAPPANALWQFTPSGDTGKWAQAPVEPASNFSSLVRVTDAAYTTGNGLGFALGGKKTLATEYYKGADNSYDWQLVPGLVMYNSSSQEWFNYSSLGYSYYGYSSGASATFVPTYGEEGLLMVFGGWTTAEEQFVPFQAVAMFDPVTQEWASQETTGDIPKQREAGCTVGIEGDDGTYEIYLHGGRINGDTSTTVANGAVHVLSLPSFTWTLLTAPQDAGRYSHSCNVAGKSQMIVVGGVTILPDNTETGGWIGGSPDPWVQGIGVYDLSKGQWADGYNADAAEYVTPQTVKDAVAKNGKFAKKWSSPGIEAWFTRSASNTSLPADTSDDGKSSSSNVGPIAGGVVGGVLFLALVGGITYLCLRRRKKARAGNLATHEDWHEGGYQDGYEKRASEPLVEADGEGHQHELPAGAPLAELGPDDPLKGPTTVERYELEDRGGR